MPFDNLSPAIVDALREHGITEPTEPQKEAIPRILKGENILLVAPTGIGKTEAAMLPILNEIYNSKGKPGIRCIYVTPLRALNRDMLKRMEDYGKSLDITVGVRHGDTPAAERNRQSLHPPEILITTPETLQVLFTGKRLIEHLKHVEWFVVDEIHELATTERGAQMCVAMERLVALAGEYQRIGLSATVGNVNAVARFLSGIKRDVRICKHDTFRSYEIDVECPQPCEDPILLDKLQCDPDMLAVMKRAKDLIENGRSTLLFVNTRETAEWMAARYHIWDENMSIDVHHGSLSKENRMDMEDRFKRGDIKALVCTSSLELGIDVGSTDLVIQYNSPRQISRMIQRAGRAGHRVGEKIRAKIIATSPDEVCESLVVARKTDAKELENKVGRPCPLTVVANQLIAMTMSGRVTRDEAFAFFKRSYIFRDLKREDIDAVLEQLKSINNLEEKKRVDEIQILKAQINPHMIYNTLNVIQTSAEYQKNTTISEISKSLAMLLRYSVTDTDKLVLLEKEFEYLKGYMTLMQHKFVNDIHLEIMADDSVLNCMTLKMLLQPIVENSLKHGFTDKPGQFILIKAYRSDNKVLIKITDNGVGIAPDKLKNLLHPDSGNTSHLGLNNVNRRIKLTFGSEYGISISSIPFVQTSVMIEIPYIPAAQQRKETEL